MGCSLGSPRQLPVAKVLFIGLQNSGKTTALFKLRTRDPVTAVNTTGCNVESFECAKVRLEVWDVGGMNTKRPQYAPYYKDARAVVFFIDCSDTPFGLNMAIEKLKTTLLEDVLDSCPIAIVANKQDVDGAMCAGTLTEKLTEKSLLTGRNWRVFPAIGQTREGLSLMMTWVEKNLKSK